VLNKRELYVNLPKTELRERRFFFGSNTGRRRLPCKNPFCKTGDRGKGKGGRNRLDKQKLNESGPKLMGRGKGTGELKSSMSWYICLSCEFHREFISNT